MVHFTSKSHCSACVRRAYYLCNISIRLHLSVGYFSKFAPNLLLEFGTLRFYRNVKSVSFAGKIIFKLLFCIQNYLRKLRLDVIWIITLIALIGEPLLSIFYIIYLQKIIIIAC